MKMPGHPSVTWMSGQKERNVISLQPTTLATPKTRHSTNSYQFKAIAPDEAKRAMNLPFLPETAYIVSYRSAVLGIVVYHVIRGMVRDWFAEGCLSHQGLRHSFGTREKAAIGLRLQAQREGRL